jgi:hypothetical protein
VSFTWVLGVRGPTRRPSDECYGISFPEGVEFLDGTAAGMIVNCFVDLDLWADVRSRSMANVIWP